MANIDAIWLRLITQNVSQLRGGSRLFLQLCNTKTTEDSFRAQIAVARCLDLPIIVHARDADNDVAAILENEMKKGAFRGVLHCFTGAELAERAIDIGFYISFSGILTFNKAEELRNCSECSRRSILVETDYYLAPVPIAGVNEPAYTTHAKKLAAVRENGC